MDPRVTDLPTPCTRLRLQLPPTPERAEAFKLLQLELISKVPGFSMEHCPEPFLPLLDVPDLAGFLGEFQELTRPSEAQGLRLRQGLAAMMARRKAQPLRLSGTLKPLGVGLVPIRNGLACIGVRVRPSRALWKLYASSWGELGALLQAAGVHDWSAYLKASRVVPYAALFNDWRPCVVLGRAPQASTPDLRSYAVSPVQLAFRPTVVWTS
ncbi:MAG TPA: hypothetical protein VLI05_03140 [Candidatus Saccharimonadia bacterium]|nr:hypothetical protein [Candidatus Saccharimonadia bacterium]